MNEKLGKTPDFCTFLVDRGLMEPSDAEDVRARAASERTPIGQLLVMRGVLSVRQVMTLLELQADLPGVRFGELALRVGYVTTVQLEDALKFQATHRRHQIAIVAQDGQLARPDLDAAVVAYVHFLELQA
ncbi:MAG: hypothetical protein ACRBN8_18905 [Nannocystales bacterium]